MGCTSKFTSRWQCERIDPKIQDDTVHPPDAGVLSSSQSISDDINVGSEQGGATGEILPSSNLNEITEGHVSLPPQKMFLNATKSPKSC